MVDGSRGVGVDEFDVSNPPDGAALPQGKSHMFRRDHVDAACVDGGGPEPNCQPSNVDRPSEGAG
jgi:hypothetical protein